MNATGIVRNIDDVGRMCLPRGPRLHLGMEDGVFVQIHLDKDGDGIVISSTNVVNKEDLTKNGIFRKIDVLGRVVIPSSIRRLLNIEEKSPIQVFIEGDNIILKKYIPGCIFTGEMKDVISYGGYNVSKKAIQELARIANII